MHLFPKLNFLIYYQDWKVINKLIFYNNNLTQIEGQFSNINLCNTVRNNDLDNIDNILKKIIKIDSFFL